MFRSLRPDALSFQGGYDDEIDRRQRRVGRGARHARAVVSRWRGWFQARAISGWGGGRKAIVFLLALPAMFLIGLLMHGRMFPFEMSEPLVGLAAVADLLAGLPWVLARMLDGRRRHGDGGHLRIRQLLPDRRGLLNFLVILDAFDIAMGRK